MFESPADALCERGVRFPEVVFFDLSNAARASSEEGVCRRLSESGLARLAGLCTQHSAVKEQSSEASIAGLLAHSPQLLCSLLVKQAVLCAAEDFPDSGD